jgi:hypothetical protein
MTDKVSLAENAGRLARGWRHTMALCERIRRRDEGRPLLELVKDKDLARARESE